MALRKVFFVVCLIISMFCLAAGYGIAGQWIGVVIAIFTGLTWLFARKYPASWLPFICLLLSVCLAVIGLLMGASSLMMIFGSGFSLAVWDLIFLGDELKTSSYDGQTRRYEYKHLQSLALALGCGLIATFVGRLLNFKIPFVVMILFIVLFIFGFKTIWDIIKKRNGQIQF